VLWVRGSAGQLALTVLEGKQFQWKPRGQWMDDLKLNSLDFTSLFIFFLVRDYLYSFNNLNGTK